MKVSTRTIASIGYKLFFAFLGFSALVSEIVATTERGTFNFVNFFSFFTVQVNILVVATLVISAVALALGKAQMVDRLRSAVAVYIAVVGVGFSILLAGLEGIALTAVPWDNTVLHYIIPVAMLVDLLIDRPRSTQKFTQNIKWLLYPLAYMIYSLIRGAITGWYPYPFLNVTKNGYVSVVVITVVLLIFGLMLIRLVSWYSGRKRL